MIVKFSFFGQLEVESVLYNNTDIIVLIAYHHDDTHKRMKYTKNKRINSGRSSSSVLTIY